MKNNIFKKLALCGALTARKHHARSQRNDKRIRKKRIRRLLNKELVTSTIGEHS